MSETRRLISAFIKARKKSNCVVLNESISFTISYKKKYSKTIG